MKIVTVIGARPQFIKAAAVSRAIRAYNGVQAAHRLGELILHTGQHYDENMSQVFFDELDIPEPRFNLEIGGGSHGQMTGRMLEAIERVLTEQHPDWVLIYGDTNSTLAGALAAAKLHIPVAHVEAGLRSFNMRMPEEINRVVADRISNLLLCPTEVAVRNLQVEGVRATIVNVGDVMYDASLYYRRIAIEKSRIAERLALTPREYVLATCHRAENTDNPERLSGIAEGLARVADKMPVVLPLHPRTRKLIDQLGFGVRFAKVRIVEPVAFFDMLALEAGARVIATDSGGVQKEAYFFEVPCVTLRDETEWTETVESGWNRLVGADPDQIEQAIFASVRPNAHPDFYGDGRAAERIVRVLLEQQ